MELLTTSAQQVGAGLSGSVHSPPVGKPHCHWFSHDFSNATTATHVGSCPCIQATGTPIITSQHSARVSSGNVVPAIITLPHLKALLCCKIPSRPTARAVIELEKCMLVLIFVLRGSYKGISEGQRMKDERRHKSSFIQLC